jgi:hypothetical protein
MPLQCKGALAFISTATLPTYVTRLAHAQRLGKRWPVIGQKQLAAIEATDNQKRTMTTQDSDCVRTRLVTSFHRERLAV